jgi:hypothetical protein
MMISDFILFNQSAIQRKIRRNTACCDFVSFAGFGWRIRCEARLAAMASGQIRPIALEPAQRGAR